MFHWTADRVRSHVLVCFLALVLESALQRTLAEQDPHLSYELLSKLQVAPILSGDSLRQGPGC